MLSINENSRFEQVAAVRTKKTHQDLGTIFTGTVVPKCRQPEKRESQP